MTRREPAAAARTWLVDLLHRHSMGQAARDPYDVLGVSRSASHAEIRSAYKKLAQKFHPDKHGDNPLRELAAERLAEINGAYAILGDPDDRARYDRAQGTAFAAPEQTAPRGAGRQDRSSLFGSYALQQIVKTAWTVLALIFLVRFGTTIVRLAFEGLFFVRMNPVLLVLVLVFAVLFYGGYRRGRPRRGER